MESAIIYKEHDEFKKDHGEEIIDDSERFLIKLADFVNQGFFNKMQIQDAMFGVVKVDWNKMVQKHGKQEPYIYFIGYSPSKQLNLEKLMNVPSLIGLEDPDSDTIRKVVMRAINSPNPSLESDYLKEFVPQEAFGVGFHSTVMAIRDKNNRVIGGFGIATHLDIYKSIFNLFDQTGSVMNELSDLKDTYKDQEFEKYLGRISDSSEKLKTQSRNMNLSLNDIKNVADKTKLLSFNASIEAARAGQYGKGFSVVSSEIRILAEKSKSAIDKIIKSIESTSTEIEELAVVKEELDSFIHKRIEINNKQLLFLKEIDSYLKQISEFHKELSNQGII